jgi:hypothetical protein
MHCSGSICPGQDSGDMVLSTKIPTRNVRILDTGHRLEANPRCSSASDGSAAQLVE